LKKGPLVDNLLFMHRAIINTILLASLVLPGFSADRFSPDNSIFLRLEQQLSHNTGTTILKDKRGFLWVGTANGLNRFDGQRISLYEFDDSDSSSISNNFIRKIVESPGGDLWIATENGLNRYIRERDEFRRYYFDEVNSSSLSSNTISDITVDSSGTVWVAAGDLCRFRAETDDFVRYNATPANAAIERFDYNNFVYVDRQQNIWYGYWHDLYLYNPVSQQLDLYYAGENELRGYPNWQLHDMVEDQSGTKWIATNRAGLLFFRTDGGNPVPRQFHDMINQEQRFSDYRLLTLFSDENDNLWISCENAGIVLLDTNRTVKNHYLNNPEDERSISGNSIWSIYQDDEQRIWFGTWNAGISYIDPYNTPFQHFNSSKGRNNISNNIVTDFLEDAKGNLWIATDGGGLNYFNRTSNRFTVYRNDPTDAKSIGSDAVLSLSFDSKGHVWAGTYSGGISVLNPETGSFRRINQANSDLSSNNVFDLFSDGRGKMYIATWGGGLNILDETTGDWEVYLSDPPDQTTITGDNVFVIEQDSGGSIWVGTVVGLNRFYRSPSGKGMFQRFQKYPGSTNGLSDNRIHSIYNDRFGRLWVGTSNGLNLFNAAKEQFSVFNKENGLPTSYVSGIVHDQAGNLWISSLKGITEIDSAFLRINKYDISDNLQGNQFNRNAVLCTKKGELLFGGTNGFNLIDPEHLKLNPYPPRLVFTDLKISNKSEPISSEGILQKTIGETRRITLSYLHSVFSLDFVALNFTHPEKNQYAFMMEGFEPDWNYAGSQNSATYTNLDAGEYTFRVKAANNDGVWNDEGIALGITITPPFWKTWWAYLLYFAAVIGAFYLYLRYQISQERLRYELEMEHSKLERLSEMDKIKSRFFANVAHEIRTPIMLIVGPLENLIKSAKVPEPVQQKLALIIRNAQRLSRMMYQLVDYYQIESPELNLDLSRNDIVEFMRTIYLSFKEYAREHQVRFDFNSNIEYGLTWFDGDKIDKIAYNLLSNAFKFTPNGGTVTLSLNYKSSGAGAQNFIEISVADNGVGISREKLDLIFDRYFHDDEQGDSAQQGIGIGLNMTRELVELHQGEIDVRSEAGKGTTFIITLPMDIIDLDNPGQDAAVVHPAKSETSENSPVSPETNGTALLLIVDDEQDVQQYVQDVFTDHYKVITANDGQAGVEKALEFIPDLIISDIKMPRLDGYAMCSALKNNEQTSHIPIILLTVQASDQSRLKGIKSGADAYLPKPFNSDELRARVENMLDQQRKVRETYRKQLLMEPKAESVLSLDEKFLLRVKQEIDKNVSDWKLDAEKLSEQVGISRIQLYRKLKGLTGQTVHEFIRSVRLRRAVQLLDQRKMKISEIAYHVGFNDLNYFSRCFRKEYGQSPSEYLSKTGTT
jgi:signal transduction histidine kinase/ligand-binding sensor domain-containing protein/DNA-binding response OmpR family regulator